MNIELLDKVMAHIADHPEQHDQSIWMNDCGTAACVAGWVCLLSGYLPWQNPAHEEGEVYPLPRYCRLPTWKKKHVDIQKTATRLLDINDDWSAVLFHASNSVEELQLMAKDLANGEKLPRRWRWVVKTREMTLNGQGVISAHGWVPQDDDQEEYGMEGT